MKRSSFSNLWLCLMIFSCITIIPSHSYAQYIEDGQPHKPLELTDPKQIEAVKKLAEEYLKFRKNYVDCAKDKKSISTCMCQHIGQYKSYSEAYNYTVTTAGVYPTYGEVSYPEEGQKKTVNLQKISEIDMEFSKYCYRDINGDYTPIKDWEKPPLKIKKEEEVILLPQTGIGSCLNL